MIKSSIKSRVLELIQPCCILYYLSITVREIFLNNGTRELISVTPNTGKAELWGKQI